MCDKQTVTYNICYPVFRICDILIRIRIRTTRIQSGPGSCFFLQWIPRCHQKKFSIFSPSCLTSYVHTYRKYVPYIHISLQTLKITSYEENCRNQDLSKFVCLMMGGSGSAQQITDPDLGGPKTYGSGSGTLSLLISTPNRYLLHRFWHYIN